LEERNTAQKLWGASVLKEGKPNVAKSNFGGKKAAPFVKGGGRKKSSTKTAKGLVKKKASGRKR
jgi:hypothetical protein